MPIKEQFKEINWLAVAIQLITVAIALWGMIAIVGDGRWANREDTEETFKEIATLNSSLATKLEVNTVLDGLHVKNTDVHQPAAAKRAEFVSREEWMAAEQRNTYSLQEVKEEARIFFAEQREVNAEQRAVYRQLLERLPK